MNISLYFLITCTILLVSTIVVHENLHKLIMTDNGCKKVVYGINIIEPYTQCLEYNNRTEAQVIADNNMNELNEIVGYNIIFVLLMIMMASFYLGEKNELSNLQK